MSWNSVDVRIKILYGINTDENGYDFVHGYDYVRSLLLLWFLLSVYISKILENDNLNLEQWNKIKIVFHLLPRAFMSLVKIQS